MKWLKETIKLELLTECLPEYIANSTKIFLNGRWIGIVKNPQETVQLIRLHRRLGLLSEFLSINWSIQEDIIYIYVDGGRLCRPIFVAPLLNDEEDINF